MSRQSSCVDIEYFMSLVSARCGKTDFILRTGISEKHFAKIISGDTDLRQDEMRRFAFVLELDDCEFTRCFFKDISSEKLNLYM